jgi:hypothetical protein
MLIISTFTCKKETHNLINQNPKKKHKNIINIYIIKGLKGNDDFEGKNF